MRACVGGREGDEEEENEKRGRCCGADQIGVVMQFLSVLCLSRFGGMGEEGRWGDDVRSGVGMATPASKESCKRGGEGEEQGRGSTTQGEPLRSTEWRRKMPRLEHGWKKKKKKNGRRAGGECRSMRRSEQSNWEDAKGGGGLNIKAGSREEERLRRRRRVGGRTDEGEGEGKAK